MDELDISAEREQIERESLVAAVRRRQGPCLLPVGECYACGELVERPRLFCDSDCATSWERRRGR